MKIQIERVLTPEGIQKHGTLTIENGTITNMSFDTHANNAIKGTLVPGYIDTQVNGGGGVLFNQQPTVSGLHKLAKAHLAYGTTGMLPTLITDNASIMQQAADAIATVIRDNHPSIVGVHFEGPYLHQAKKGVHEESLIRVPSDKELAILTRSDLGKVMVTVAPDNVSSCLIGELVAEGVVVSLGHSNASGKQVQAAIDAGATGFTHLYNAMSPLHSREPGMVGTALNTHHCYCGLIVDHHHVHPQSAALAIKVKTPSRTMLVTDAMAHVGSRLSELPFFNTVIQRNGDKLTTPDGTLAGSCLNMHQAVLNCYRDLGIDLHDAVQMATQTPATFLNLKHQLGSIEVGQSANLLLLDNQLNIKKIWLHGSPIDTAEGIIE